VGGWLLGDALYFIIVICASSARSREACFNSFDEVVAAVIEREDMHFITPSAAFRLIYALFGRRRTHKFI
jgi:hypothetical protein